MPPNDRRATKAHLSDTVCSPWLSEGSDHGVLLWNMMHPACPRPSSPLSPAHQACQGNRASSLVESGPHPPLAILGALERLLAPACPRAPESADAAGSVVSCSHTLTPSACPAARAGQPSLFGVHSFPSPPGLAAAAGRRWSQTPPTRQDRVSPAGAPSPAGRASEAPSHIAEALALPRAGGCPWKPGRLGEGCSGHSHKSLSHVPVLRLPTKHARSLQVNGAGTK